MIRPYHGGEWCPTSPWEWPSCRRGDSRPFRAADRLPSGIGSRSSPEKPATPDTLPAPPGHQSPASMASTSSTNTPASRACSVLRTGPPTSPRGPRIFGRDHPTEAIAGNRQLFAYPFFRGRADPPAQSLPAATSPPNRCPDYDRQPRAVCTLRPRTQNIYDPGLAPLDLPGAAAPPRVSFLTEDGVAGRLWPSTSMVSGGCIISGRPW